MSNHRNVAASIEPAFECLRDALRVLSAAMSKTARDAALERLLSGAGGDAGKKRSHDRQRPTVGGTVLR